MAAKRILYMDPDPDYAQQVQRYLHWRGYQVSCVHIKSECQYLLRQQRYDIVLFALSPNASEQERTLESIQSANLKIPVILIGERQDIDLVRFALRAGCADFLHKRTLVKQFFEELNLSLFRIIEKRHSEQHDKSRRLHHQHRQSTKNLSAWTYFPEHDIVNWTIPGNTDPVSIDFAAFLDQVREDDRNKVRTQINICLFSGRPVEFRFRYLHQQSLLTFQVEMSAEKNEQGEIDRLTATFRQVEKVCHQDDNAQLKLAFLDNTADAIFITDHENKIVSVNENFTRITGYSEQDVVNKETTLLNPKECDHDFFKPIIASLHQQHFWQGEITIRHKEGHNLTVWQSISVLKDGANNIARAISVLRDISHQKAYEQGMHFQANYDPLTQLPNRTLFQDRLDNAIKQARRKHKKLALMLLDLDKFKWINDNMGHHAGDILLQETGKKLQAAVRNSDTVARLGGDEFAILLPDLDKATDSEFIARKIFNAFLKPVMVDGKKVNINGSIGITLCPDDGTTQDQLFKNADSAMYKAKHNGRNRYFFYTRALQQETERRQQLLDEIRYGLGNHQFELHYQPIIDRHTRKIACAETLLRWNHPRRGYIPLTEFMPVAEESGLICDIGEWAVATAAANMSRWQQQGLAPVEITLNQSPAQYNSANCHQTWLDILRQNRISPSAITFEINEKVLLDSSDHRQTISQLQQEGAKISLDGFGTGYSSLGYLKQYAVDVIKIDRSCIQAINDDHTTAVMVETIVNLADKLGIKLIATGVENAQQLASIDDRCRFVQGYYFSKPMPVVQFERYLQYKPD